ncbi:MAG TPA: cytochrome c, partial [Vicinamibacterales bacterium]|nr:cytochrome c [Vicinamibacterales bacterium]
RIPLAVVAVLAAPLSAGAQTPTFAKDVAPIFYSKCVECHRPTMFAPMSLVTFDEARPWAKSIRSRVAARTMPPWGADPAHGTFKNDPRLSDKEIATILAWVDGGAPKGDDTDLPTVPTFVEGWTIGKPDAVFTMEKPFEIPATGTIDYQYIRIPTGITENKWLAAIEIKPEARAHVHHVIAFTVPAGSPITAGAALGPANIGGVTPNKPGVVFEPGVGRMLNGNSDIVLQMHYTTNGRATTDRTQVGLRFLNEPPQWQQRGGSALNLRLLIPAGAPSHEVRASRVLTDDTLLTSLTPHMHVRGKDMTYTARYPDGRTEVLLSVPNYDFNWQITYQLKEAKRLPKGTTIEVVAHFDNSPQNKFNPDPTKDVRWGDQTWEEMMIGFWGSVAERSKE